MRFLGDFLQLLQRNQYHRKVLRFFLIPNKFFLNTFFVPYYYLYLETLKLNTRKMAQQRITACYKCIVKFHLAAIQGLALSSC
jgi:hypothetical protein